MAKYVEFKTLSSELKRQFKRRRYCMAPYHTDTKNGGHFTDGNFKFIIANYDVRFSKVTELSSGDFINDNSSVVGVRAWCRRGDKPLHEPMMTQFNYVTRPQCIAT